MIIVAALVALIQVTAARSGTASPLSTAVTSGALGLEEGSAAVVGAVRGAGTAVLDLPALRSQNATLHAHNLALTQENARLQEELAAYRQQVAVAPELARYHGSIEARVIGYPPENAVQSVSIDQGSRAGVAVDDGVVAPTGVVGRVVEVGPFTSKVALLTDFTSTIPALVQRGRFWGIAKGNQTSVHVEYISQDAPLRIGDRVVTGEARSFHSGAIIGTIIAIERSDSALYQTAIVKPAVDFSTLDRVVVLPK